MKKASRTLQMIFFALAVFLVWSTKARAEETIWATDGVNTLDQLDPNPTSQTQSVNGEEAEVLEDIVYSQNGPINRDEKAQNSDVSNKYGQVGAAGAAMEGKAMAIVTGVGLIARGTPMSASIIPSTRAAGLELIAKGALELAQAAANARAQSDNTAIETQLRSPDPGGDPANAIFQQGEQAVARVKNDAFGRLGGTDFEKSLTEQGISLDHFIDEAVSGNLGSTADVANFLNVDANFSDLDSSKGSAIAAGVLDETYDDKLSFNDATETDVTLGTSSSLGSDQAYEQGLILSGDILANRSPAAKASGLTQTGLEKWDPSTLIGDIWHQYANRKNKNRKLKDLLAGLTLEQLNRLGLIRKNRGPNIFTKARRSYQSFSKWRDVARHP